MYKKKYRAKLGDPGTNTNVLPRNVFVLLYKLFYTNASSQKLFHTYGTFDTKFTHESSNYLLLGELYH